MISANNPISDHNHNIQYSSNLNENDLVEYQEKIKQRIKNKRRNDNINKTKEDNNQKLIDNSFRIHWREGVKKKRSDLLSYFVDKKILRETIKNNPNVLIDNLQYVNDKSNNGLLTSTLEDKFEKLVADIDHIDLMNDNDDDAMDVNNGDDDNYQYSNHRVDIPISSIQSTQAEQFLQKSITFNLAVNKRIKKHRESFESEYRNNNRTRDSVGSVLSTTTGGGGGSYSNMNMVGDHRMYSSFEKEDKVNHLVMNLINSSHKVRTSTDNKDDQNSLYHSNGDSSSSGHRIKTIGFMSRIISNNTKSATIPQSLAMPFSPMMNMMRSRSTTATPMRSNSITVAFNPNQPIESTAMGGGVMNGNITATDEDYSKNSLFCSLVDSVFLIGPNSNSVENQVKAMVQARANNNDIDIKDTTMKSDLDPIIVFMTQCDNPDEMFTLLPSYCFPSGVEIQVVSNKSSTAAVPPPTSSSIGMKSNNNNNNSNNNNNNNNNNSDTNQNNSSNSNTSSLHRNGVPLVKKQSNFMTKQVKMLRRATEMTFKPAVDTVTHELEIDGAINLARKLTDKNILFEGISSISMPHIVGSSSNNNSNTNSTNNASTADQTSAAPQSDLKKFILGNSMQIPILSNVTNVFFSSMESHNSTSVPSEQPSEHISSSTSVKVNSNKIKNHTTTAETHTNCLDNINNNNTTVAHNYMVRSKAKTPFILLLGDHSYQQYGLALHLPMTFKYPQYGVTVHTSYVLCLMTKVPFFTYLYHILEQFDSYTGGLTFDQPVPKQDLYFPYLAQLKPLNDLAIRLKKLIIPMYPYITNDSLDINNSVNLSSNNVTTTTLAASTAAAAVDGKDVKCILPTVSLTIGASTTLMPSSRKLEFLFKRSVYQEFYSTLGFKIDNTFNQNRELNKFIEKFDKTSMNFIPRQLHKLEKEKEDSYLIMLWALPVLLKYLPLDQIILALGCTVTEMKIIVQHKDFRVVSSIILALIQLLKPLKWCSPVIVVLPDELIDFIESPVPIIIGLQKLPENFLLLERFVVIDPQERIVHLNPSDVVESHTILLPHASKLIGLIRSSAETIQKLTKRRKTRTHVNHGDGVKQLTLPVELDIGSYENMQLLSAIKTFTDLVSNHIQALLNTAIHMQHEKRQNAKDFRRVLSKSHAVSGKSLLDHRKSMKESKKIPEITAPKTTTINATTTNVSTSSNTIVVNSNNISSSFLEINVAVDNPLPKYELLKAESTHSIKMDSLAIDSNTSSNCLSKPLEVGDAKSTIISHSNKATKNIKSLRSLSPINNHSHQAKLSPPNTQLNNHQNTEYILTNLVNNIKNTSSESLGNSASNLQKPTKSPTNAHESLGKKIKHSRHSFPDNLNQDDIVKMSLELSSEQQEIPCNKSHSKPSKVVTFPINNSHITPRSRRRTLGVIAHSQPNRVRSSTLSPPTDLAPQQQQQILDNPVAVVEVVPSAVVAKVEDHSVILNLPQTNTMNQMMMNQRLLQDDNSSEITNTDHGLQPNMKLESTDGDDDAEDMDDRSNDKAETGSISSASSSLPSLKFNAPLLLLKEIGHGGVKFMEKIQDTQMFSNYCQYLKLQSSNKAIQQANNNDQNSCSPTVDGNESLSITTTADVIRSLPSAQKKFASPIFPGSVIRQFSKLSQGEDSTLKLQQQQFQSSSQSEDIIEMDALLEVFSIALTGTIPMDSDTLQAATDKYTDLYHTTPNHKLVDEIMKKYEREFKELEHNSDNLLFQKNSNLSAIDSYINKIETLRSSSSEKQYPIALKDNDTVTNKDQDQFATKSSCPIIWCNGLSCGGYSNTPYCTSICLTLWERKLQVIRQQAVFKSIIRKHHHSQLVMKDRIVQLAKNERVDITSKGLPSPCRKDATYSRKRRLSNNSNNQDYLHDNTIQVVKVNLQPKLQAMKHNKETVSQYAQRKDIIKNRRVEIITEIDDNVIPFKHHTKKPRRSSIGRRSSTESTSIYGATSIRMVKHDKKQLDNKQYDSDKFKHLLLYARRSSADPATFALAKYYADKEMKSMKSKYRKAFHILKPLLIKYIAMYRKYKFHSAVYTIQAIARGFFVRNRIPKLVQWLIDRKKERLLACIRIRRFLRLNDAIIYKRFMIMKREKQRKRLQTLSIPVKVSGNLNLDNKSGMVVVPLRLTSDSLNHINKMSSKSFLDIKQNNSPSKPIHNESEVSIDHQKNEENILTQNTLNAQGQDHSSNPGTRNPTNITSGSNNNSGKHLRNSVTYSDRVKEYLQFGKIITRASNHISTIASNTNSTLLHKRLSLEKERSQHAILDESSLSPRANITSVTFSTADIHSSSLMPEEGKLSKDQSYSPNSDEFDTTSRFTPRSDAINDVTTDNLINVITNINESDDSFALEIVSKPSDAIHYQNNDEDMIDTTTSPKLHNDSTTITQVRTSPIKSHSPKKSLFDMLKHSSMDSGMNAAEDYDDLMSVASCSTTGVGTILSDSNSKKFSPLCRYVAETNMDLKHIISPRSDSASLAPSKAGISKNIGKSFHSASSSVDSDTLTNAETILGTTTTNNAADTAQLHTHQQKQTRRKSFWSSVQANKKGIGSGFGDTSDMKSTVSSNNSGTDDVEEGVIITSIRDVIESVTSDSFPQRSYLDIQQPPNASATTTIASFNNNDNSNESNQPMHSSQDQQLLVDEGSEESYLDEDQYDDHDDEDLFEDEIASPIDNIIDTYKAIPLKTLGPNAIDSLNRQQMHKLLEMWGLLRNGVNILKHGHNGKPKFKTLFCDINMTKLYWRSIDITKPDPSLDNTAIDLIRHPYIKSSSTTTNSTDANNDMVNHKKNKTRLSIDSIFNYATGRNSIIGTKTDADREFYLKDILEVRDDCHTAVMQRSLQKHYISEHLTSIISLVLSDDLTFDFEIEEDIWGSLYHALKILINYYQDILPSFTTSTMQGSSSIHHTTTQSGISNSRSGSFSSPKPLYSYLKYDSPINHNELSTNTTINEGLIENEDRNIEFKKKRKSSRRKLVVN